MTMQAEQVEQTQQRGSSRKNTFEGQEIVKHAETAITAAAENAKAIVQAKFLVAMNRPRSIEDARVKILAACKRPRFAEMARYSKPVGNKPITGPSIRFADEAVKIFGNVDVSKMVIYEDEDQRIVRITVVDLETNTSKSDEVTIKKTIERKSPKQGQDVLGSRQNTKGETVYLIRANDDETNTKEANLCAKARRNLELQIIPQDIIEEAMDEAIMIARKRDAEDPDAAKRQMIDAFVEIGVRPSELEKFMRQTLDSLSPADIADLRQVYQAINQGEASWRDFMRNVADDSTDDEGGNERAKTLREKIRNRGNGNDQKPPAPTKGEVEETEKRREEQKSKLDEDAEQDEEPGDQEEQKPPKEYTALSHAYDVNPSLVDACLNEVKLPSMMELDWKEIAKSSVDMNRIRRAEASYKRQVSSN